MLVSKYFLDQPWGQWQVLGNIAGREMTNQWGPCFMGLTVQCKASDHKNKGKFHESLRANARET